ncbi:MAG TPA: RNA polymerase sporulation sigma factor SigK [Candidatus Faeciplasma avium]|uniref:RNA polymerase sigma factor n=1 Tax=Candidatus Faeciplasma avium TaxID=2840798 RepID=A0A9D1T3F4_9FIRM|nr:RNA polymerase sporulation sigma factor SigK [Candidatus Faeciplasma avium]
MFWQILQRLFSRLLWLALHIEDKNLFPKPLSSSEESEMFKRMSQGDSLARDRLILHNLRLVAHIVKKYSMHQDQEELISIGTVGLIKAINTFDSNKGNRFAAYGSRCIENEILMHFRNVKKASREIRFDEPIDTDKDGNQLTLRDIIAEDGDVVRDVELSLSSRRLYELVDTLLEDRERRIIVLRYGLYSRKPLTQRETAKLLGISRSYVSRIEKRALEKLREGMEG